jgi:V/A-type H+-transporting ATPase subunit K
MSSLRASHRLVIGFVAVTGLLAVAGSALLWLSPAAAAATETAVGVVVGGEAFAWGLMAAALATGLAALGAGYAVATVGTAAVGALAEKPELLGRLLILVGLAEGIAIYGLIVAVLILNRLG